MAGDRDLERARTMARVLDRYLVDPLLGTLLPGIGDVLGSVIGLYIVAIAVRRHVSPVVIARMLLNLGLDAALGIIPIVGDALDFGFHANIRNVELLTQRSAAGGRATSRDWLFVGGAAALLASLIAVVVWAVIEIVQHLSL
jgi:hypothetical protein